MTANNYNSFALVSPHEENNNCSDLSQTFPKFPASHFLGRFISATVFRGGFGGLAFGSVCQAAG